MVMLPHMDAAYGLARYLSRDATAAEDIVQNAFLRALRGFEGFRGEAAKAWLLAIVRNCFLDWVAANGRHGRSVGDIDDSEDGATTPPPHAIDHDTPEAILGRRRDAEMLRATIENLPEPFRETLVLRELEELSYKEIAMITEVPIGTVMSRLVRARHMLCALLLPAEGENREMPS